MVKVLEKHGGLRLKKLDENFKRGFTSLIGNVNWSNEIIDIDKDSESYKEYLFLKFKSQKVFKA